MAGVEPIPCDMPDTRSSHWCQPSMCNGTPATSRARISSTKATAPAAVRRCHAARAAELVAGAAGDGEDGPPAAGPALGAPLAGGALGQPVAAGHDEIAPAAHGVAEGTWRARRLVRGDVEQRAAARGQPRHV